MLPLQLRGARVHNLKGIDLDLQPGQVVLVTGVSGSGKSSLALDTLYAEGQRRFVESFSPYARQFLERLQRPPMDSMEPVPAAVAVDRGTPAKSSRSTVATMTDMEPMVAALFLREAMPVCPEHGLDAIYTDAAVHAQRVLAEHSGERLLVGYPLRLRDAEHYLTVRDALARDGYRRLWVGEQKDLDLVSPSEALGAPDVEAIVDRVSVSSRDRDRLLEALQSALARGQGSAGLRYVDASGVCLAKEEVRKGHVCPRCAKALPEPSAGMFSYDSPVGACKECKGFGRVLGVDLEKVFPDPYKSLKGGAIRPWTGKSTAHERRQLRLLSERNGIPMDVPFRELSDDQRRRVLEGDAEWAPRAYGGVLGWFRWLQKKSYKMHVRVLLARYRSYDPCPACNTARLAPAALAFRVAGHNIAEWHSLEVERLIPLLRGLEPRTVQGALLRQQLLDRLAYLDQVGLGYLSLDRQARTLSGGEAQRVTLTAALGTSLHNALFVLDEPSVGLHAHDVSRLAGTIQRLAERGNIVVVVEHDRDLISIADRVVELGPGAGAAGGQITFDGSVAHARATGGATARALEAPVPRTERRRASSWLRVRGVTEHNLKDIDVDIPLGVICGLCGPSGSGKSTLAEEVLFRALARRLRLAGVERPGAFRTLDGAEAVRRVVLLDQSPLGRTSRGNPATYTKAWDALRRLFAAEPAARQAGLGVSHFSFNVDGGRCEACAGEGYETVEMQFLADVSLLCPVCKGARFKEDVLRVTCRGLTVDATLRASVSEILALYRDVPAILRSLAPLQRLGLGYLSIGQPLSTLSGGEAQRLKLARALGERLKGTLFIVDEPSAGLHVDEVERVLSCLELIVQGGGSVVVVEHDVQVLSHADWLIELGPGAGFAGGEVCMVGTPPEITASETRTGRALATAGHVRSTPYVRSMATHSLTVTNAREHTLKDVTVSVPHEQLTVVTGPSGSGKSSLVFDVLFAEGQRRFLETLTPYARRFLPTLPKPDVDAVSGMPPAIALEQRTSRAGANSTVATVTEVSHYVRLLFSKLGIPHCPTHGLPLESITDEELFARARGVRGRGMLLAPAVEARKGSYAELFNNAARAGVEQAIVDGKMAPTEPPPKLARTKEHTIELVIYDGRFSSVSDDVLAMALQWGNGSVIVRHGASDVRLSVRSACASCGLSVPTLDPRWFSFNTAQGRCPSCEGAGVVAAEKRRGRGSEQPEATVVCPACQGSRLHPIAAFVSVAGLSYRELSQFSIDEARRWTKSLKLRGRLAPLAEPVVAQLAARLDFLHQVGLDYLGVSRPASTLSGGEMQRLRLAAQLGAGLTGALYVLDEPTIGLHPRDTARLIDNLKRLVALGSTVVVVEHDLDVVRAADYLIDMGPTGGRGGGSVIAAGPPAEVLTVPESPTGRWLQQRPEVRKALPLRGVSSHLRLTGAAEHNLRGVDIDVPLGRLSVVAGVSGSGKSTLVSSVMLPAVRRALGLVGETPGKYDTLSGLETLKRALSVDQSPIGRTPRSVPATFLGIWDAVRQVFAGTPAARQAGFGAARFSFNTTGGGRCEACLGQGVLTHAMSFLPDTVQPCPTCRGRRFEERTLGVAFAGLSVADVLDLSADEALGVFGNHPKIRGPLETLCQLGAGYIRLGQGSHTLSGGEAQRLKLANELTAGSRHEPTLYVLDEPTTGLHQSDVGRLLAVLSRLVDRGDTLVVVEHHPHVIASADFVLELGPEAGARGGRLIAACAPRALARRATPTGRVLRPWFE